MTTDFRALCAELADAYLRLLEHVNNSTWLGYEPSDDPLLVRARAALAAPEQGPTDAELLAAQDQAVASFPPIHPEAKSLSSVEYARELEIRKARAVLARWGRPAVEPVPVNERLPGPEDCDDQGRCWCFSPDAQIEGISIFNSRWYFGRIADHDTHWLPHWALPVPQEGADGQH